MIVWEEFGYHGLLDGCMNPNTLKGVFVGAHVINIENEDDISGQVA